MVAFNARGKPPALGQPGVSGPELPKVDFVAHAGLDGTIATTVSLRSRICHAYSPRKCLTLPVEAARMFRL